MVSFLELVLSFHLRVGPRILESVRVRGVYSNTPYKETSRIIAYSVRNNEIVEMVVSKT